MENFKVVISRVPVLAFWLVIAAVCVFVFFSYRRLARAGTGRFAYFLLALKYLAVFFIVLLFLDPVLSWQQKGKEKTGLCVLVDGSRSMGFPGSSGATRAENALQIINSSEFQELKKKFKVRYFQFSQGTLELSGQDLSLIKAPEGRYTDISQAFNYIEEKFGRDKVSACVLISDGASNYGSDPVFAAQNLGVPVFAVGTGGAGSKVIARKVSIAGVQFNRRLMADNIAQIEVTVKSEGFQNQKADLELKDGQKTVYKKQVLLDMSKPVQNLTIQWIPQEIGSRQFKVIVSPQAGVAPAENGFSVYVASPHLTLLYIEGTPRWEFKFLKRALEADRNIDLTCFLRMGKTKFLQVDSAADQRKRPFPTTIDELSKYQIVIIGDVERNFLGDDFLANLSTCVSEGGQGVLFLGTKVFGSGTFERSPIAQALPIVAGTPESSWITGDFYINLTKEGALHPIFNYLEDPEANRKFWSTLPVLSGCVPARAVKIGATVLAVNPNVSSPNIIPVLMAVQNFGKGKTAVWGADTTWKWKVNPSQFKGQEDAYQKFWGQVFRWLVRREPGTDAKPEIQISLDKDRFSSGEPVRIMIQAPKIVSAEGAPEAEQQQSPQVQATLTTPDNEDINLTLKPVVMAEREWYSDYFPASPGSYKISAKGRAGNVTLEQREARFTVTEEDIEMAREGMDESMLTGIAAGSGGKYYTPETLASLPAEAAGGGASIVAQIDVEKRLHDMVYLFGFIGAISAEWLLRKKKDLF